MQFSTVEETFDTNADGLYIRRAQEIPTSFVDFLKDLKNESTSRRASDFELAAAVPAIVVSTWRAAGFDVYSPSVSVRDVVARLKSEGLDDFVCTRRRV